VSIDVEQGLQSLMLTVAHASALKDVPNILALVKEKVIRSLPHCSVSSEEGRVLSS
jgi:hypothetical protein